MPSGAKPGPKKIYGPEVAHHLHILWLEIGQICSKNMRAALPNWLPFYDCPEDTRSLLLEVSSSTIDRVLKPYKEGKIKAFSSTRPAETYIKNKIPIKLLDDEIKEPGFIGADTIAHCGKLFSWRVCKLTDHDRSQLRLDREQGHLDQGEEGGKESHSRGGEVSAI
jgi:hypothetical protein